MTHTAFEKLAAIIEKNDKENLVDSVVSPCAPGWGQNINM